MMTDILVSVVLVLCALIHWRLRTAIQHVHDLGLLSGFVADQSTEIHTKMFPDREALMHDEMFVRVRDACSAVGLNGDTITPEFNLASTGKLHEVLHQVTPLVTVQDVVEFLNHGRN